MRLLKVLVVFICLIVLQASIIAQSGVSTYQIRWSAVDETDVVAYSIYYEERQSTAGFTLVDGLDPSVIPVTQFFLSEVFATGQSQYLYELVLNDDELWVKVGVVAKNSVGQIGYMGSHVSPVQKQSPSIPIPSGVSFNVKFPQ